MSPEIRHLEESGAEFQCGCYASGYGSPKTGQEKYCCPERYHRRSEASEAGRRSRQDVAIVNQECRDGHPENQQSLARPAVRKRGE